MEELTEYLMTVGRCALVVVEEDLHRMDKTEMKSFQTSLRDISPTGRLPRLAFNAVGGSSAKSLLKLLDVGGTMVTYGGMSGKGIEVGTPQLIFKDLQLRGYWHSRWLMSNDRQSKQSMVDCLSDAVLNHDVVCPPVETFSLQDLQAALHWQSSQQSSAIIRKKLVWDCRDGNSWP
jgi:NADPH:quinone reductase-like Zn-dependent oxidoreductase